jgi:bifunctional non-homologous end joining protein LigD
VALAFVENGQCRLVSGNGHTFTRWDALKREIAASIRCRSAVLDGEIACLDPDGRTNFYALLFGRRAPFYCVFDALILDGEDLRSRPLLERKRRLLDVMPVIESRVRYVDHVHEIGVRFFELACERDLEGVVGKFAGGIYWSDAGATSWVKFKNPGYTQAEGRAELFESRRGRIEGPQRRVRAPKLVLA